MRSFGIVTFNSTGLREHSFDGDGGVIEASLEADGAERSKAMRNPNANANVVPKPA